MSICLKVLNHPNVSLKASEGQPRLFPTLAAIRVYFHSSWYIGRGYGYWFFPYYFYHWIHRRSCVACPRSWYKRAQSLTCIFPAIGELWLSALFLVDCGSDHYDFLLRMNVYLVNCFASAILSDCDYDFESLIGFRCYGSAFKFWIRD